MRMKVTSDSDGDTKITFVPDTHYWVNWDDGQRWDSHWIYHSHCIGCVRETLWYVKHLDERTRTRWQDRWTCNHGV